MEPPLQEPAVPRPRLGPALSATIVTRDLDHSIAAYTQHLDQRVLCEGPLDADEADVLGWPGLAGNRTAWLGNALGEPWLRLLESPQATAQKPFTHYGWLSLEIAVADCDALGERLANSPFDIIGQPADLAMSDAIRAMQVVGPSGEVLYLTQVKRPVPPFELPMARCSVDRLFIPVMLCPDRSAARNHYEQLSGNAGMEFDTLVTVINRALGLPMDTQHPVAVLQLAGDTLIEMDQVPGLEPAPFSQTQPPSGIAFIHFQHDGPPLGPLTGAAGERIELIQPPEGTES